MVGRGFGGPPHAVNPWIVETYGSLNHEKNLTPFL